MDENQRTASPPSPRSLLPLRLTCLPRLPVPPGGTALALLLGLLLALTAAPAVADDVYLTNGAVFEGVVTHTSDSEVTLEMAIGTLTLPRDQVARVVPGATPIAEFRERRNGLLEDPTSGADRWLELARWGLSHGLESDARGAALLAARLDPGLEGLDRLLPLLGLHEVEGVGWLPHDQAMRLQGRVLFDGEWLTPAQKEARLAEERHRPSTSAPEPAPSDNEVALASIELAREALDQSRQEPEAETERPDRGGLRYADRGVTVWGGVLPHRQFASPEAAAAYREQVRRDISALAARPPGSIIPMEHYRATAPED